MHLQYPNFQVRNELYKKRTLAKSEFIDALWLAGNSEDRGTFHLGSFAKPLKKENMELAATTMGVKAFNARICDPESREETADTISLFNSIEILSVVGNCESERALAALAYTCFDMKLLVAAIRSLKSVAKKDSTKDLSDFDYWWDTNKS